jgi:hypothetical protein
MLNIPEEKLKEFDGPFLKSEEAVYPEDVTIRASYLTHIFGENLKEDFIDSQLFFEEFCVFFITDFIEGGDFSFSIDTIAEIKAKSLVRTALKDLKEEGLIDSIDDETGEEIIFLTKEGVKYYKDNNLEEDE